MAFAHKSPSMTATYLSNIITEAIVVWLAMLSVGVIAYLLYLQVKEIRRNRRMDAVRERFGLRRA